MTAAERKNNRPFVLYVCFLPFFFLFFCSALYCFFGLSVYCTGQGVKKSSSQSFFFFFFFLPTGDLQTHLIACAI